MNNTIPLKIKRNGERKCRFTVCGNQEHTDKFKIGSLFAPCLSETAVKAIIAFATYYRLNLDSWDAPQCFLRNEWKDTSNPRKISTLMDKYASWTGKEEIVAVERNQYGFRDASATWANISEIKLINFGFSKVKYFEKFILCTVNQTDSL